MKALQTEVGATVSPSYGYLGQTLNVYLYFTTLTYDATPTIDYLRFSPHGVVGAANLTVNSSEVISADPLIILASVSIPTAALTGIYDVLVGLDDEDYEIDSGFVVYESPYQPAEVTTTMLDSIMPLMVLMMVMMMMMGMMKGMFKS